MGSNPTEAMATDSIIIFLSYDTFLAITQLSPRYQAEYQALPLVNITVNTIKNVVNIGSVR